MTQAQIVKVVSFSNDVSAMKKVYLFSFKYLFDVGITNGIE